MRGLFGFSGDPIRETDETADLRWFAVDSLPENISPITRRPLAFLIERIKCKYGIAPA
jgi:hypothetical protein